MTSLAGLLGLLTLWTATTEGRGIGGCKVLDLTHTLSDKTPVFPVYTPFQYEVAQAGYLKSLDIPFVAWGKFCMFEHTGTHMDAPYHFAKDGQKVDEIPLEHLVGEACVINVEAEQARGPRSLSLAQIKAWEAVHGRLGPHCILLLATGQAKHFFNASAYFGTKDLSDSASFSFASFGEETGEYIRDSGVKAVGVDAISIDGPSTGEKTFPVHHALLEANIPGFENMANLHRLPPRGSTIFVAPMKIAGGTGAPLRAYAIGWQNEDPCSAEAMDPFSSAPVVKTSLFSISLLLLIAQLL